MSSGVTRQPVFLVYSRQGCHLCDVLVEELLPMIRGRAGIEILDVDSNDTWRERYGLRIPLVEFDGQVLCQFKLDPAAIHEVLQVCAD